MPSAAQSRPSPDGWRARDPGHLWSVAYRRDPYGAGHIEADPPRLGTALRCRCYRNGVDVGGDAVAVLRVLVMVMATDGRPVALEAIGCQPSKPRPKAKPKAKAKPKVRQLPALKVLPYVLPCPSCSRYRRAVPNLACGRCGDRGWLEPTVRKPVAASATTVAGDPAQQ